MNARDVDIPTGYFKRLGDAVSQTGNVLIFNGQPNESISGRSHRQRWTWARWLIDWVLVSDYVVVEPDDPHDFRELRHCQLADLRDEKRAIELLEARGYRVIDP
jgi:very-short-patch-repair endonuclease